MEVLDEMDLTPKTDLLIALANAELPERHVTALGEFIDNALGEAAGNAEEVIVYWDRDRIQITDNGQGVAKLSALFTLGDSQSRLSRKDIGQFGYGAKVGALYLGWEMRVETVYEGKPSAHSVDWHEVQSSKDWRKGNRKVEAKRRLQGTSITISHRHKGRVWQAEPLVARLAHIYRPALLAGRSIKLVQRTGSKQKQFRLVESLSKFHLEDRIKIGGEVDGKPFIINAGRVRNLDSRSNGVHIAFGHRFIKTETRLPTRHMPPNFYAEVFLSEEWKTCLTATKSNLAFGRDELMAEVEKLLKPLLDKLERDGQELQIKSIIIRVNRSVNEVIDAAIDATGTSRLTDDFVLTNGEGTDGGGRGGGDRDMRKKAKAEGHNLSKPAKPRGTGVEVRLETEMGKRVARVDATDISVRVSLNKDLILVDMAYKDQRTLLMLVLNALLDAASSDLELCKRVVPPMADKIRSGFSVFDAKQSMLFEILKAEGGLQ